MLRWQHPLRLRTPTGTGANRSSKECEWKQGDSAEVKSGKDAGYRRLPLAAIGSTSDMASKNILRRR